MIIGNHLSFLFFRIFHFFEKLGFNLISLLMPYKNCYEACTCSMSSKWNQNLSQSTTVYVFTLMQTDSLYLTLHSRYKQWSRLASVETGHSSFWFQYKRTSSRFLVIIIQLQIDLGFSTQYTGLQYDWNNNHANQLVREFLQWRNLQRKWNTFRWRSRKPCSFHH